MASAPGFARSRATMAGERSMPCTPTPPWLRGQGDAAGPDPELERAASAGKIGEEGHSRVHNGGLEHVG